MNAKILLKSHGEPRRGLTLSAILSLALWLAQPFSATGTTSASGSLNLQSFSATPSSGSIAWGSWTLSAFVSANNSDGDLDFQFQTDPSAASAFASVPYASGNSSANFPSMGGSFAHVGGMLNLPGNVDVAASVFPALSTLETTFSITGASGLVSVTFAALLSSVLMAMADTGGAVLLNDVIFNLNVDGISVLYFFDSAMAGPGGSASSFMNPALTGSIMLDAGMSHSFTMSLEYDPVATGRSVPEQGPTGLFLLIAASAVIAARRFLASAATAPQKS